MSWLSDRTGIHLGNVGAPVGALVGSFFGMPQLGAALGQGVGSLGAGKNIGQSALSGAEVYGGSKLLGAGANALGFGADKIGSGDYGTSSGDGAMPDNSSSGLPFGLTAGDLLKFVGNTAGGVANYAQDEASRKQQLAEFMANYGLSANQQMMTAQSQLNRAPLADKGQYLALNQAAPTAFQPRDYTKGFGAAPGQFGSMATGGPAAQLAANQAASAAYVPGAGNVNTGTLRMILQRLGGGSTNG